MNYEDNRKSLKRIIEQLTKLHDKGTQVSHIEHLLHASFHGEEYADTHFRVITIVTDTKG